MTLLDTACPGTCTRYPHRADTTDPQLAWCSHCHAAIGTPTGHAHTTAGTDLEPPFGHPTTTGHAA